MKYYLIVPENFEKIGGYRSIIYPFMSYLKKNNIFFYVKRTNIAINKSNISNLSTFVASIPNNSVIISFTLNISFMTALFFDAQNVKKKFFIAFLIDSNSYCAYSTYCFYVKTTNILYAYNSYFRYIIYKMREKKVLKVADVILYVSNNDADFARKRLLSNNCNDFDKIKILPLLKDVKKNIIHEREHLSVPTITFLATYSASVEHDVVFFIKNIYYKILMYLPSLHFRIAGVNYTTKFANFLRKQKNVRFLGRVDSVEQFYRNSTASISILAKKCGLLNKILDSFIMNVPVIGYTHNFVNISGARNGIHFLAADSPVEFAYAIKLLHANYNIGNIISFNAFNIIKDRYNNKVYDRRVDEILSLAIYGQG